MRDFDEFEALEEYKMDEPIEIRPGETVETTGEWANEAIDILNQCPTCRESTAQIFNKKIDKINSGDIDRDYDNFTNFLNLSKALIPHITEEDVRLENARRFEEIEEVHGDLALYDALFSLDYGRVELSQNEFGDLTDTESVFPIILPTHEVEEPDEARRNVLFAKMYSGYDASVNSGIFCVLDEEGHSMGRQNNPDEAYDRAKNTLERLGYASDVLFSNLESVGERYQLSPVEGHEM